MTIMERLEAGGWRHLASRDAGRNTDELHMNLTALSYRRFIPYSLQPTAYSLYPYRLAMRSG